MSRLVYVIGAPASGKTTLVEAAAGPLVESHDQPFAWRQHEHAIVLGALRPPFSGTDTLSMSVSPRALAWVVGTTLWQPILAEGDRLAHIGFLGGCADAGVDVTVVYLRCDPAVLATRREDRTAAVGKAQNPTWVRGRESKAERLATAWQASGRRFVVLDSGPLDPLVASVQDLLLGPEIFRLA
jgi:hypothetical protein